jgi:formylglycine-generating enzyme required for sulfatase activity
MQRLAIPAALTCLLLSAQDPRQIARVPAASTGRRLALLIGNKDYSKKPLTNPVNDATDLAAALKDVGFDATLALNLNRRDLDGSVRAFAARVQPGDTALFYFSGHGMEVEGQNYLLPIDFDAQAEEDVRYQALPASQVQDRLHGRGARVSILILDACRNNPYRSWKSGAGGLAAMSGKGAYVAFAAAQGQTADDNPRERNGRFTKHLLTAIRQPGLGIDDVFNRVRDRVEAESGGNQVPFSYSGVVGGFSFVAGAPERVRASAEEESWDEVKDSRRVDLLQGFIREFPDSPHVRTARLKIAALEPRVAEPRVAETPVPVQQPASGKRVNPKDGLTYVWIPSGQFTMGCSPGDTECYDDETPRRQNIAKGFWLGESEVTQAAYRKVTGKSPSPGQGPDRPVDNVDWSQSVSYCRAIGGRLPTEAEWEYAARAGTTGARYGELDRIAWTNANSGDNPHDVKQKEPNAWGLYDMLGNLWEWTDSAEKKKPLRGGSCLDPPENVRSSTRDAVDPADRNDISGFRCVWE